jgi:hypothetical protein
MADQIPQSFPLDPKPDECELHPERLRLEALRLEPTWTDEALLGMQMGNLILAAVYGVTRVER